MIFLNSIKDLKKIDKKIIKIIKNGVKLSFLLCLFASFILFTYCLNNNPIIFNIGISIFKTSLFYICTVIMCGIAFNKITDDLK